MKPPLPPSDARRSPQVPAPRNHRISRSGRRGRSPGASGAECQMNDRARARGSETKPPPATCGASAEPGPRTHLGGRGGRAAGGDRAQAGARPAVAASRQCAPRRRRPASRAGERASLQLGAAAAAAATATEPTRLPGPASVSAAVLGSPWRGHPRTAATLGAPEVTLRRRPPAVTPREPPIVSSQRRRRRRATGTRGAMSPRARGPGRPFLSLSRRRPRAAHQPPAAPRRRPPLPESPRVPGRLAHLQPRRRRVRWTPGRHRARSALGAQGGGGEAPARRGTREPARAELGRSGQSRAAGTSLRTALRSRAGRVLLRSKGRERS